MLLRNRLTRFGFVAVSFHWIIALCVLGMIVTGLRMTHMEMSNPWLFPLFQFHKSLGVTIFLLVVLRLVWRGVNITPLLPQGMPRLEQFAAKTTHWLLYAALILMPLTGWIIVSASSRAVPTIIFGLFSLPHLQFVADSPNRKAIGEAAEFIHQVAAWSLIALASLHALAALRHLFWLKDGVMQQMWFTRDLFKKEQ